MTPDSIGRDVPVEQITARQSLAEIASRTELLRKRQRLPKTGTLFRSDSSGNTPTFASGSSSSGSTPTYTSGSSPYSRIL